jgi:hypothetical protein
MYELMLSLSGSGRSVPEPEIMEQRGHRLVCVLDIEMREAV